jgi:protein ImuA
MYSILVDLSPVLAKRSPPSAEADGAALRETHSFARTSTAARAASHAPDPLTSHALWRAHQLGAVSHAATASGFISLDAELPGSGWPHRMLTELLLPHPGLGELRLLMPALARITRGAPPEGGRNVMLFDPPAALCGPALTQLGLDAQQLLVVHGREGVRATAALRRLLPSADLLWALEQALKSGHIGAVLAWLPSRVKADALRRLQLAAQAHDGPAFLFREVDARSKPSAAPLRLLLQSAGIDRLAVRVLKRRGPPLMQPLLLELPPVLSERQRARARDEPAAVQRAEASSIVG